MKSINSILTQMNDEHEKQKQAKIQKDKVSTVKSAPKSVSPPKVKKEQPKNNPKKSVKKDDDGFWDNVKGFLKGEKVTDGVSLKGGFKIKFRDTREGDFDTTMNKIGKVREGEKPTKVDRFINRAANSATLGIPKELTKRTNDELTLNSYYNDRKVGKGGGADLIADGLGYITPGAAFVKGAKLTKAGANAGAKGIQKALQLGKEGAVVGGAMAATEVGIREALNGKDTDWKDNAKHIAFGTATGAIADPLIHGAGKVVGKGFEKASDKAMKNLMPKDKEFADVVASNLNPKDQWKPKQYTLPDGKKVNFKNRVQHELKKTKSQIDEVKPKVAQYEQEFQEAVEQQYEYLKNSMGKGVDPGGLVRDQEGYVINAYGRVSKNPKWYQDFYKQNGRKPNQKELRELAEQHVREGFYDEGGSLPPWAPKKIQEIDDEIDNMVRMMGENPEQVDALEPIIKALEDDREGILKSFEDTRGQLNQLQQNKQALETTLGKKQTLIPEVNQKPVELPSNVLNQMNPQQVPTQPVQYGIDSIPPQQPLSPVRESMVERVNPEPTAPELTKVNERAHYGTVGKSEKATPEFQQRLNIFDKTYVPMSNQETVDIANEYIKNDIEKAYQFVKNSVKFDPRHIVVGHRLIDEFQKAGDFDRALDVIERLAEQGTKHGQSIQAFSIYNRLTVEGQLLRVQRNVNRINQSIPDVEKHVKLDEVTIKNITHAADSIQRLTGQEEIAKNVINIMDSIKKGKTATDDELEIIREFVTDARKFVGDLTPKKERVKVKSADKRTRDKVVDFFNKEEELAKAELRKIMKRANSLPVDFMLYASRYGAAKIAKGMVSFADFTEEMIKDLGEEVRPYIKQVWDKSAELFNLQSEKMTSKRLSEVEKIVNKATKDKTLSAEEATAINRYLDEYLKLTGDAKLEASMQLQATLQLLERPSFASRLSTAQTIAQLLNPKTIVRNALGNELFYRVEQINKLVATPIDMALSTITGSQRTITFRTHNQGQYWHNWMMGLKAGWKGVNPMGLTTMYDLGPQAFRGKYNPLTYMEKSLGAVLRSFDHAGYMRAYNKSVGELATLRAVNEGLKGQAKKEAIAKYIREADDNIKHISDAYAKYATFQDNTMLATALQKTKKGLNKVSTLGITDEFGLGDLVLKYPKTPGNLIMRALEYSPAGLIRSSHLLKDFIKTKDPFSKKETIVSFTRAITGTAGFSMLGFVLADMGILTTAGHSDYEVASLERNAGKQPNSVNVTAIQRFVGSGFDLKEAKVRENDTFVSYDWAQPVSLAIALGTGINQSVKEEQEVNAGKAAKRGFDSAANTVIEMSVLGGLNDFLASYPGRTLSDRLTDAGKGIASSFTPTFVNQMRQLGDNTSRTTYSPNPYEEIGNKAINRIPGLEKSLPLAYDTLGNQRENFQGGSNNLFNVLLNPSFVSKYKPSEEAKFVLDYINQTGDKTVAPRIAQKKLDGIALTGEQHARYQRIMGEETQKGLENLVPKAKGTTNLEKVKKSLDGILRKAGERARDELRKELN
jgi:hypothetical protein